MKLISPGKIADEFIMKPVPPWKTAAHLHQTKLTNTLSPIFGSLIQGAELIEVQIQVAEHVSVNWNTLTSLQIREVESSRIEEINDLSSYNGGGQWRLAFNNHRPAMRTISWNCQGLDPP